MYSLSDSEAIRNGNTMEGGETDFTSQWGLTAAPTVNEWEEFRIGRKLYREGKPLTACVTVGQRRGWTTGYRRDADAHCGIVNGINMLTGEVR